MRIIEAQELLPSGSGKPEQVDLRVISATNEDPRAAVEQGRLRQDLLFRLEGFTVSLPPLAARLDDIPLLMVRFLQEFAASYGTVAPELTAEDLSTLIAHDWPGNVRELKHVAERLVILSLRGQATVADALSGVIDCPAERPGLREAVAAFERQMIGKAIQTYKGRMDEAADALGIGRRTLNEKIVKLGLDKDALL